MGEERQNGPKAVPVCEVGEPRAGELNQCYPPALPWAHNTNSGTRYGIQRTQRNRSQPVQGGQDLNSLGLIERVGGCGMVNMILKAAE